jgi:CBS domain containing-hemolysin-like protein
MSVRDDIPYLDVTWPVDRVLRAAVAAAERRWIPLCRGSIHNVIGAVSPSQVASAGASGAALTTLALPVVYVADTQPSRDAAADTADPEGICPLVVFVDEYGATTGTAERRSA